MKVSILLLIALLFSATVAFAITYPYLASPDRQAQIRHQYPRIKAGMTEKEVRALLGNPDVVSDLYEHVKASKPVGSTLWYVVSQQKEHGSENEVLRKAVAIRLDMSGRVTRVDPLGL